MVTRRVVVLSGLFEELSPHRARQRLAVRADPNRAATGGIRVRGDPGVNVHEDQAAGPFRYHEFLEDRRELRIRSVMDGQLEAVDRDFRRDAEDRAFAAGHLVRDAENHCPAAAVGHAHGGSHGGSHRLVQTAGVPFLEVEILGFKVVGGKLVEPVQKSFNIAAGSRHRPHPRRRTQAAHLHRPLRPSHHPPATCSRHVVLPVAGHPFPTATTA